ncbi:hypothetical protein Tco_0756933 [Tanacetum coccineum]
MTKPNVRVVWQKEDFTNNDVVEGISGVKDNTIIDLDPNGSDSESEVDEMLMEPDPRATKCKGASTLSTNVPNVYVCTILESHVDISTLSKVCSNVFRSWDWSSNAGLCDKGCRIIVGWNIDDVDLLIITQSTQAMHIKLIYKATKQVLFVSFIYAANRYVERQKLWNELGSHKHVVRRLPWILMGDFNMALNMEDYHSGSSSMSLEMIEFKDFVSNIEVLDINSTGIHYTWNQKPKGGGGVLKKLDRIMGNLEFCDTFLGASAIFQPYRISDHSHAVLKIPVMDGLRHELDEVQKAPDANPDDPLVREEEAVYLHMFNEAKLDEERWALPQQISDAANLSMIRPVTNDEIKMAMLDIGEDRAPGPDRYTLAFFLKLGISLV